MQHPLKSTQSLNIDWDKPKLLNGAKNQLLFCKNPEKPKTSCLRRTSDSLVVLHRPVEPAPFVGSYPGGHLASFREPGSAQIRSAIAPALGFPLSQPLATVPA